MKTEKTRTCEPLVFGPAFAMDRRPGLLCLSLKFSSAPAQTTEANVFECASVNVCGFGCVDQDEKVSTVKDEDEDGEEGKRRTYLRSARRRSTCRPCR